MRVVIDTNVLVSALILPYSLTGEILIQLRAATFTPVYSMPMVTELAEVLTRPKLARKYGVTADDALALVDLLAIRGELVVPISSIHVCRDPKDDMFLAAAVAGAANAIVSGDADLLALASFQEIAIITPRAFLATLRTM